MKPYGMKIHQGTAKCGRVECDVCYGQVPTHSEARARFKVEARKEIDEELEFDRKYEGDNDDLWDEN